MRFPSGAKRANKILELLHSDVFGPVLVPSLGKSLYDVSSIYEMFTEIKIQRAIRHTFYHTISMQYLKALLSNMSKPLMPCHGIFSRDRQAFHSTFENHRTISPSNNSVALKLVQSSNLNSPHYYQCSLKHITCIFLEHYFST